VVGTGYCKPEEKEPSLGRILVFRVDKLENADNHLTLDDNSFQQNDDENADVLSYHVSLVTSRDISGAVFSLACVDGKLVAGVGSKVKQLYYHNLFFKYRNVH
jgi:hypothetical protein